MANEALAVTACQKSIQLGCPDRAPLYDARPSAGKQCKTEEAFKIYRQALTLKMPNESAYQIIGDRFFSAGCFEEAVKAYRRAIRLNTNQAAAYGLLPTEYEKLKQHPEAMQAFKQAVESKPSSDGYAILGSACEIMGWYKDAAEAYAAALRVKDEQAYGAFAMTGTDGKKSKRAIQSLKQAIQVRPHDAKLYHQLGTLYVQMNLDANALEVLKHAVRLNRQNTASWTLAGTCRRAVGAHHDEAWQAWREVIRLNPNDLDAQANLGGAYAQLGRFQRSPATL